MKRIMVMTLFIYCFNSALLTPPPPLIYSISNLQDIEVKVQECVRDKYLHIRRNLNITKSSLQYFLSRLATDSEVNMSEIWSHKREIQRHCRSFTNDIWTRETRSCLRTHCINETSEYERLNRILSNTSAPESFSFCLADFEKRMVAFLRSNRMITRREIQQKRNELRGMINSITSIIGAAPTQLEVINSSMERSEAGSSSSTISRKIDCPSSHSPCNGSRSCNLKEVLDYFDCGTTENIRHKRQIELSVFHGTGIDRIERCLTDARVRGTCIERRREVIERRRNFTRNLQDVYYKVVAIRHNFSSVHTSIRKSSWISKAIETSDSGRLLRIFSIEQQFQNFWHARLAVSDSPAFDMDGRGSIHNKICRRVIQDLKLN